MDDQTPTPSEQQQRRHAAADFHSTPRFPHHQGPRTWLIVAGVSSLGLRLARMLLAHGDNVVLGAPPAAYDDVHSAANAAAATAPTAPASSSGAAAAATAATGTDGGGGGGGGGDNSAGLNAPTGPTATLLDRPFARHESELLRQFLVDLDEDERRDEESGADDEDEDSEMEDADEANLTPVTGGKPGPEVAHQGEGERDSDEERAEDDDEEDDDDSSNPPRRHTPRRRRLRCVRLDPRAAAQCQGAVATATAAFGSLDILVCNSSEVVIGTVEELGASDETLGLVREQFEVNFFSSVNAIKAAVPVMRRSGRGGHIVVITGISGHLGTPGLGAFCSAGWALEGYCDSIAYEIAPFNIKVSIVQPHLETAVLPNHIKAPPSLPQYAPPSHPAPLARNVIGGLLDRIHGTAPSQEEEEQQRWRRDSATTEQTSGSDEQQQQQQHHHHQNLRPVSRTLGSAASVSSHEPRLPAALLDGLIKETLFSVCAIGGHPSPPQRHIVGTEGVVSVKEKLKTVSVELEDLVQASTAVDLVDGERE